MTIDRRALELECRVFVLEHMLQRLFAFSVSHARDPAAFVEDLARGYRDTLRLQTFDVDDPALSDLAAGEVEEAFDRFLAGLRKEVGRYGARAQG